MRMTWNSGKQARPSFSSQKVHFFQAWRWHLIFLWLFNFTKRLVDQRIELHAPLKFSLRVQIFQSCITLVFFCVRMVMMKRFWTHFSVLCCVRCGAGLTATAVSLTVVTCRCSCGGWKVMYHNHSRVSTTAQIKRTIHRSQLNNTT